MHYLLYNTLVYENTAMPSLWGHEQRECGECQTTSMPPEFAGHCIQMRLETSLGRSRNMVLSALRELRPFAFLSTNPLTILQNEAKYRVCVWPSSLGCCPRNAGTKISKSQSPSPACNDSKDGIDLLYNNGRTLMTRVQTALTRGNAVSPPVRFSSFKYIRTVAILGDSSSRLSSAWKFCWIRGERE